MFFIRTHEICSLIIMMITHFIVRSSQPFGNVIGWELCVKQTRWIRAEQTNHLHTIDLWMDSQSVSEAKRYDATQLKCMCIWVFHFCASQPKKGEIWAISESEWCASTGILLLLFIHTCPIHTSNEYLLFGNGFASSRARSLPSYL